MKKHPSIEIRKIHLETFIDMLVELYHRGINYIDIQASMDGIQDGITVMVKEEYFDNEEEQEEKYIPLSEKDFNNLIV